MSKKDFFSNQETDSQFVISYELLCLLRWLIENERPKLKRILRKALSTGLHKEIKKTEINSEFFDIEEAQECIVDFFSGLEHLMNETINEQTIKKVVEKNLIPALEHIDSNACDESMIQLSAQKASSQTDSKENAQDLFLKEILKRWKPTKKTLLN